MATRVIAGLISVDAFDNPVCTGGVDCDHYLYEVNATSAEHAGLAREPGAVATTLGNKYKKKVLKQKKAMLVAFRVFHSLQTLSFRCVLSTVEIWRVRTCRRQRTRLLPNRCA